MLDRLPPEILILCMIWAREDGWAIALTCKTMLNLFMTHPFQLRAYVITLDERCFKKDCGACESIVEYHKTRQDGLKYQRMMAESYSRIWKGEIHPNVRMSSNRPIVVSFKINKQRRLQQHGKLRMVKNNLDRLSAINAGIKYSQPLRLLAQIQEELDKQK